MSVLLDRKAARFLHRLCQLVGHQLVRLVRGQIDPIEARVRLGQILLRHIGRQVDGEQTRSDGAGGALQGAEALQRDARRAGDELQQPGAHLGRVGLDDLCEVSGG